VSSSETRQTRPAKSPIKVGQEAIVEIGPVAHGGHFIAHHAGHTVFVRHALTGEQVRIKITDVTAKIVRADAVEILRASPQRVEAPCKWARPGSCGGCDFQHVAITHQRELKAQIIVESLQRHAGIATGPLVVEPLGDGSGLHWRSRIRWSVDSQGRPGLLAHRSHSVVRVDDCLLATPGIAALELPGQRFEGAREVRTVEGDESQVSVVVDGYLEAGRQRIVQEVSGRSWKVDVDSFWQVHPQAAPALVDAVLSFGQPSAGEQWWDLYSGVGLFSAFVAEAVGSAGAVHAVETSGSATRDARRSLHDLAQVTLHEEDVLTWLEGADERPSGVVLDPPRAGAGQLVVEAIARANPRVVIYVACDPVALARDVAFFAAAGYRVAGLRAFDSFPMTHHVETVAALVPNSVGDQIS
jgi:tRNA/tmRNA/rRNA uracil-C5-methylase (TrmA/RlmC/RlmD family)